jgi:ribonuclease P protein subunit RPR2
MKDRRKKLINSSVRSSIEQLLEQSRKAYSAGNAARSKRYVKMAFELLKKHRIRLPKELKNSFCRKCHAIWIPEKTVSVYYDRKTDALRVRCGCGFSKRL